jgi:hypothetical protein
VEPNVNSENQNDEAPPAGSLEQLREILFGAAYRELERKLARMEAHLAARTEELQQEARRRTEVLEEHLRQELESLGGRLERESQAQSEAVKAAARDAREVQEAIAARVGHLEDGLARAQRESRQQLLEQAKSFLDELHRVRTEVIAMLEREFSLARGGVSDELEEHAPGP